MTSLDSNRQPKRSKVPAAAVDDLQVIARSAAILEAVAANRGASPVEIGEKLGLTRTTTHRYIASLVRHGFLRRESKDRYSLGPLMLRMGVPALRSAPVSDVAAGPMSRLARMTQQTVALAVWAGPFPVVIRSEDLAQDLSTVTVRVGGQLGTDTSHAKIFFAFMTQMENRDAILDAMDVETREQIERELPTIRRTGISTATHSRRGLRAIAAPIFEHPRNLCASLAIVGRESALPADTGADIYDALRRAADDISHLMGATL